MKWKIALSLFLNCLLGCLAVCLLMERGAQRRTSSYSNRAPGDLSAVQVHGSPAVSSEPQEPRFDWSQIESADYRVYVANLRRIGCPEQTVRDIITADVHALYAPQIEVLEISRTSSNPAGRTSLDQGLIALRGEESALVEKLLGTVSSTKSSTALAPGSQRIEFARQLRPIAMPLVFQPADLTGLHLSDGQLEAVTNLRQRFLLEIGGVDQEPNDPAYRERWEESQPALDQDLRGFIGTRAFQEYQLRARSSAAVTVFPSSP